MTGFTKCAAWLVFVSISISCGCMKHNTRIMKNDHALLIGSIDNDSSDTGSSEASFWRATFGSPANNMGEPPAVWIELADGRQLFLPDVTYADALREGAHWSIGPEHDDSGLWPTSNVVYLKWGYRLRFIDAEFVGIEIDGIEWSSPPALWDAHRTKRFPFPLSERDIRELLGDEWQTFDKVVL